MSTDPVRFLLAAAMRMPRDSVERMDGLLAGLDALDGDPDLEAEQNFCLAGDDGCSPTWRMDRKLWGSTAEDPDI